MCGIAGFVDDCVRNSEAEDVLESMLHSIQHRGPDARGKFFKDSLSLGHNRLSIIDLSDDGNQPMHYKNFSIVFNGEIYNYIEVRENLIKQGFSFKTKSDTEVILVAYDAYGENCVTHFIGMWAFAIWDDSKKQLFCSRDRFGIKPFYYIHKDGAFYFASEYKALKKCRLFDNKLNLNHVSRGLQLGWNAYKNETYFECVLSLEPSSNLIFNNDQISFKKYWTLNLPSTNLSYEFAVSEYKKLFYSSLNLHMRSDVEVGACLSGGIDSSSIASVIGQNFSTTKLKTFTIYYTGANAVDERPWVNFVCNKYKNLEPYFYSPSDTDIQESLDDILHYQELPLAGSSPISQYFVMKLAKQNNVKVLLDGQGSDEALAGYMHATYRLIAGSIKSGNVLMAIRQLQNYKKIQNFNSKKFIDVFLKSLLTLTTSEQRLYEIEYKNYLPYISTNTQIPFKLSGENKNSRLNEFQSNLITDTLLSTLLHFEDRNSMAFSIESRVPFLDHRLVELSFSLPDNFKIRNGITKSVLRDALKAEMPSEIYSRHDKKGFVTPGEVKWLRGPLKHLLTQKFNVDELMNMNKLNPILEDFKSGNDKNANLVWRAVIFNYWLNKQ